MSLNSLHFKLMKKICSKHVQHIPHYLWKTWVTRQNWRFKSSGIWHCVLEWVLQATDDNMAHAYCMLDTYGYKHTLRLCNTYCFYTATMVAWKHLNVAQYAHCPSCLEWPLLPTHYRCRGLLLHLKGLNNTHSAGLPRAKDRLVAETSTWQHTTFTADKHTC
jgi:hypothetical protein